MKQGFPDNPHFELLDFPPKNHRQVSLDKPFRYKAADGEIYTVPMGTKVNGTSYPIWRKNKKLWYNFKRIPAILAIKAFSWYPFVGFERKASIVHDYLVDEEIGNADDVHALYEEMVFWLLEKAYKGETNTLDYKKAKLKAKIISWSVKVGGPQW